MPIISSSYGVQKRVYRICTVGGGFNQRFHEDTSLLEGEVVATEERRVEGQATEAVPMHPIHQEM
jgi:hypothetical protein